MISYEESLKILKLFNQIINKKLNVRQTEKLVKNLLNNKQTKSQKIKSSKYNKSETELQNYLNTKTEIIYNKNNKNKILIYFKNDKHFQSIMKKIKK